MICSQQNRVKKKQLTLNKIIKFVLNSINLKNVNYKYNSNTLNYEEVKLTLWGKVKKLSYYLIASKVVSVLILSISFYNIKSYIQKEAAKENQILRQEITVFNKDLNLILDVLNDIQNKDDNIYRAIFEADPYPNYKRKLGTGGNPIKFKKYENIEYGDLVVEIVQKLELIEKKLLINQINPLHKKSNLYNLSEKGFKSENIFPIASSRSEGMKVSFGENEITVSALEKLNYLQVRKEFVGSSLISTSSTCSSNHFCREPVVAENGKTIREISKLFNSRMSCLVTISTFTLAQHDL